MTRKCPPCSNAGLGNAIMQKRGLSLWAPTSRAPSMSSSTPNVFAIAFSGRRLRHARRLVEGRRHIAHADHAGEREIIDDRQVADMIHVHQTAHMLK